jgi:cell wall-associated NlpC family hydrolase
MRIPPKPVVAALFCGLALSALGQEAVRRAAPSHGAGNDQGRNSQRILTADDGLSIIAAALDPKVRRYSGHDCSHLVHAIYERAGFPYPYASSDDLYDGVQGFRRVTAPQPGDLVVWHGHVGIVVRPSRHLFFSFMSTGPGVDNYNAAYWISRGHSRFYRYVQNDACTGCARLARRTRPAR